MSPEIVQVILAFMQRVQLNGQEVEAYAAAVTALQDLIKETPVSEQ